MQLIPYVVESIVIVDIILLVLQTQFIDHKVHLSINFKYELFLVIAFLCTTLWNCGQVCVWAQSSSKVTNLWVQSSSKVTNYYMLEIFIRLYAVKVRIVPRIVPHPRKRKQKGNSRAHHRQPLCWATGGITVNWPAHCTCGRPIVPDPFGLMRDFQWLAIEGENKGTEALRKWRARCHEILWL